MPLTPTAEAPAERNAHVHPALRGVLNAFANTQPLIQAATLTPERSAELQAERIFEWRADDRGMLRAERAQREGGAA